MSDLMYSAERCPNCRRQRMLCIGVCEKCYFDLRTHDYATDARRYEADHGRPPPAGWEPP